MKKNEQTIVNAYGGVEYLPTYRIKWLARLVYSKWFEFFIAAVILTNAIALGILTLPGLSSESEQAAVRLDTIAFWIYVVELVLRMASYGTRPWMFFTKGWNIFDFLVIGLAPFFQGQSAVLRLLRLFRLLRIFRFLPEVRILSTSILKSIPPLLSMSVLITLLLYLYGMAGVYIFGQEAPIAWGDIGASMKSLFILLTLENFPVYLKSANKEHTQLSKIVSSLERVIADGKTSQTELDFLKGELAKLKQMREPKPD
jgi:voltage-gated sodium channel